MSDPKTGVFMVGDFVHRMGDVILTTYGRVTEVAGGRDGGPGRCRVRALTGDAHDWYETTALAVTFRPAFPEGTRVTFLDERHRTHPGVVHKIFPDSELYAVLPDDHDPCRDPSGQCYYRRADALEAAPAPAAAPVASSPPPPAWAPRFGAGDRVTYAQPVNDRLEVVTGTVHMTPGSARDCYGVVPLGGDHDSMVWLGQDDLTPAPAAAPEPPPHADLDAYEAAAVAFRRFRDDSRRQAGPAGLAAVGGLAAKALWLAGLPLLAACPAGVMTLLLLVLAADGHLTAGHFDRALRAHIAAFYANLAAECAGRAFEEVCGADPP